MANGVEKYDLLVIVRRSSLGKLITNIVIEKPNGEDLSYFGQFGAATGARSVSRNNEWAAIRVGSQRTLVVHNRKFLHTIVSYEAPVYFAVSNDGFVGMDFGEPDNMASRPVVISPTGHQIWNRKLNANIHRLGVTHDEKVIWFETLASEKTQAHDLKCFAVHLEQAKLIYQGQRFRGEPIDSGVKIHEQWGPRLYFKLELEEWLYMK